MRVVVAVLTYRRTHLLGGLVADLVQQARSIDPPADVLVVDNDPEGSAREVVTGWAADGVRYAHETRAGIAAARNRALAEAGDADALVFIDDDERPSKNWLRLLVSAWQEWGCAAVAGPVVAQFSSPVDPWVYGSGVFDRRVEPTGALLRGAGAGNLLLDVAEIHSLGLTFDERLGLTGGEDTMFTRRLARGGRAIRWVDEAECTDTVPGDRATRRWVLRRAFRSASSWCRAEVGTEPTPGARGRRRAGLAVRTALHSCRGTALYLRGLLRGDAADRARGACTIAAQAGVLSGLFGHAVHEYSRAA